MRFPYNVLFLCREAKVCCLLKACYVIPFVQLTHGEFEIEFITVNVKFLIVMTKHMMLVQCNIINVPTRFIVSSFYLNMNMAIVRVI